jgi:hypothetical protein
MGRETDWWRLLAWFWQTRMATERLLVIFEPGATSRQSTMQALEAGLNAQHNQDKKSWSDSSKLLPSSLPLSGVSSGPDSFFSWSCFLVLFFSFLVLLSGSIPFVYE